MDCSDIGKLQTDLSRLGEWEVENEMKINPGKSKAVSFIKARVKERMRYYSGDQLLPEASSFKYLGIIKVSNKTGQIMSVTHDDKHGRPFIS